MHFSSWICVLALIAALIAVMSTSLVQPSVGYTVYNCSDVIGDGDYPHWSDQLTSEPAPYYVYKVQGCWGNSGDAPNMLDTLCFYYTTVSVTTDWSWCHGTVATAHCDEFQSGSLGITLLTIYHSDNGINGVEACASDGNCTKATIGFSASDNHVNVSSNGSPISYMLGYATGASKDWVRALQACFLVEYG